MRTSVWISYDLGVSGDYEGVYAWLDEHKAKECVGNVAFVSYEWEGDDFVASLKQDLEASLKVTKRTRLYAIWRDQKTNKLRGRFVFGGRRAPQWAGYGAVEEQAEVDES